MWKREKDILIYWKKISEEGPPRGGLEGGGKAFSSSEKGVCI
jgi:hypothetical protein